MKGLLKRLALIMAGLLLAALFTEAVLRVYDPFDFRVKGDRLVLPTNRDYTMLNEGRWSKLDSTIVHRKNSLGFRGPEPPDAFDDYLTVITVGGSTTECFFLSEGKTWSDVLGKRLAGAFPRTWVNNAGLDGQSSFGHLVLLEEYLVKLKPKLLLFYVAINDVGLGRQLEADRRLLKRGVRFESPKELVASLANYSEVVSLGVNLYRYSKAHKMGAPYQANLDLRSAGTTTTGEAERQALFEKHRRNYLAAYEQRLRTLIRISRKSGIEPVVITQPMLLGQAIDDVTGVDLARIRRLGVDGRTAWDLLELYNDVDRRVGAAEKVAVIDVARKLRKTSGFFYDYQHYTNDGAAEIGRIIYEDLCPFVAARYPNLQTGTCAAGSSRTTRTSGGTAADGGRLAARH